MSNAKEFTITGERASALLQDLIDGLVYTCGILTQEEIMEIIGDEMTEEERDYYIGKPVYDDTGVIIDYE